MKKIKIDSIYNSIFFNIFILSCGLILDYCINIFIMQKKSLSEYGLYNLILTYGNILGIVLGFGIQEVIKKEALEINLQIKKLVFNLLFRVLCVVLFLAIGAIFVGVYTKQIEKIIVIGIIIIVITNIFKSVLYAIYISSKKILYYYILDKIILKFLMGVVFFYFLTKGQKLEIILIYKTTIELLIVIFLIRKFINIEIMKVEFEHLKYGFYLMLHQITEVAIPSIDKILIKMVINFEAVGVYTFCSMLSNLLLFPLNIIQSKFYNNFARVIKEKNKKELKKIYVLTRKIGIYLTLPLIFTFLYYSELILGLIANNLKDSYMLLVYLTCASFINIYSGLNGTIINLSEYYKVQFYLKIIFIFITIIGDIYFLRKYNLNGAAISSSICLIIYNIVKGWIVYVKERIQPFTKEIISELKIILILIFLNFIIKKYIQVTFLLIIGIIILEYLIIYLIDGKKIIRYIF